MGKVLNISLSLDRTTMVSFGLSAAAHIVALCGLATVVVDTDSSANMRSANTRFSLESLPLPAHAQPRQVPTPATQQDLERLLAKVPVVPLKPQELEEARIRLGIDDGKANTENWVGFVDASEHRAAKSPVEQSALSQEAGKPGESQSAQMPEAQPEVSVEQLSGPQGAMQAQTEEQVARDGTGQNNAGSGSDEIDRVHRERQEFQKESKALIGPPILQPVQQDVFASPVRPGASGAGPGQDSNSRDRKERIQESKKAASGARPQEPIPATDLAPLAAPSPASSNRPSVAPSSSGDAKRPGIQDDREAEATSLTEPIDIIINGKVASAKGLRIRTVQPEFAVTTRLTARPRSPQVLITFDRTGKVVRASFTAGRNSGYEDVDQPLLNAIYKWTARGETLTKLAAASPRAELTITVNILFP